MRNEDFRAEKIIHILKLYLNCYLLVLDRWSYKKAIWRCHRVLKEIVTGIYQFSDIL